MRMRGSREGVRLGTAEAMNLEAELMDAPCLAISTAVPVMNLKERRVSYII